MSIAWSRPRNIFKFSRKIFIFMVTVLGLSTTILYGNSECKAKIESIFNKCKAYLLRRTCFYN